MARLRAAISTASAALIGPYNAGAQLDYNIHHSASVSLGLNTERVVTQGYKFPEARNCPDTMRCDI